VDGSTKEKANEAIDVSFLATVGLPHTRMFVLHTVHSFAENMSHETRTECSCHRTAETSATSERTSSGCYDRGDRPIRIAARWTEPPRKTDCHGTSHVVGLPLCRAVCLSVRVCRLIFNGGSDRIWFDFQFDLPSYLPCAASPADYPIREAYGSADQSTKKPIPLSLTWLFGALLLAYWNNVSQAYRLTCLFR